MRPGCVALLLCPALAGCGAAATARPAAPHEPRLAATPAPRHAATPAPRHAATPAPRHAASSRPPTGQLARLLRLDGPWLVADAPIGRSARGRPIVITVSGDAAAPRRVLVVGCIHGTECAGMAVTRRLRRGPRGCPPGDADLWSIPDLNPDGRAAGSRLNGRGVDLNRNFPAGWQPSGVPGDLEYAGPRPFSEPESRLARRVIRAFQPDVTIWFHQQAEPLVRAWGRSVPAARRYAAAARLPFREMPWLDGTAPHWQNTAFPGTASFVVELAPGRLSAAAAARHAHAVFALAGPTGGG